MPVTEVTTGGGSFNSLVPRYNLKRPLEGFAYPVLNVAVTAAIVLFAVSLGARFILPAGTNLLSRVPGMGFVSGAGGGISLDVEAPA